MGSYRTLFLDLDDTLYPRESGVWDAISARIVGFMTDRLSFTEEQARTTRARYVERFGTTLKGLMLHQAVDPEEYMAYVHDVPIQRMIRPDPALRRMLQGLPQAKWVLTNADQPHAGRVLHALDLADLVDGVIGFFELAPHTKPQPEAYRRAMQIARAEAAEHCVLVDDQPRNIAGAQDLGMTVVLVGDDCRKSTASYTIQCITDLVACLPALRADHKVG